MKILLLVAVFLFAGLQFSWSFSITEDLKKNTRMTLGQGVIPAYYGNFRTGKSKAVGLTSVFAYRYLHATVGVAHSFQKEDKGEGLGGTLLRVDEFVGHNFPYVRYYIDSITPDAAKNLLDRFYFGYSLSWDFDRGTHGHGIISGIEIPF